MEPANKIFFSHQITTSHPTVLFSHNKLAPATSHSQAAENLETENPA
jgi:hypothetical protein